jgi:hypothetical protein
VKALLVHRQKIRQESDHHSRSSPHDMGDQTAFVPALLQFAVYRGLLHQQECTLKSPNASLERAIKKLSVMLSDPCAIITDVPDLESKAIKTIFETGVTVHVMIGDTVHG